MSYMRVSLTWSMTGPDLVGIYVPLQSSHVSDTDRTKTALTCVLARIIFLLIRLAYLTGSQHYLS